MPRSKPTAHAQLDELRQQAAGERVKARDLEAQLAAAEDRIEDASAAIADGYAADDEKAVAGARTAQEQAIGQVKDLQHQVNGALIRIERSQQNLDAYLVDHARDLLAEREQQARTVALELARSVAEALTLAQAYVAERRQQDELVSAVPGATPRVDGPAPEHPWEPALRELQRVYQLTPELPPPLAGWQGLEQRTYQDALHRQLADERTAAYVIPTSTLRSDSAELRPSTLGRRSQGPSSPPPASGGGGSGHPSDPGGMPATSHIPPGDPPYVAAKKTRVRAFFGFGGFGAPIGC